MKTHIYNPMFVGESQPCVTTLNHSLPTRRLAAVIGCAVFLAGTAAGYGQQLGVNFDPINGEGIVDWFPGVDQNGVELPFYNNNGYLFQANNSITVTGLAAYDDNNSGPILQASLVELYQVNNYGTINPTLTLDAIACIPFGTSPIPGTAFVSVSINPLNLNAGYYVVCAVDDGVINIPSYTGNPTLAGWNVASSITYLGTAASANINNPQQAYPLSTITPSFQTQEPEPNYEGFFGGNIVMGATSQPNGQLWENPHAGGSGGNCGDWWVIPDDNGPDGDPGNFTMQNVPEPTTLSLLAVGAFALLRKTHKKS